MGQSTMLATWLGTAAPPGSLYDLLHNETLAIDAEWVLPILRDITQGLRFLHAARPCIVHGDLKAQNVLVDSKFRAKAASPVSRALACAAMLLCSAWSLEVVIMIGIVGRGVSHSNVAMVPLSLDLPSGAPLRTPCMNHERFGSLGDCAGGQGD